MSPEPARLRHARRRFAPSAIAFGTVLLVACGTPKPPAPPTVDDTVRRPANDPAAIEMLRLQNRLHNLELLVGAQNERSRADRLAAAALAPVLPVAASAPALPAAPAPPAPRGNEVFVVPFDFGQAAIRLPDDQAQQLRRAAKDSAHVVIRGRTDGAADTPAEAGVARARAESMRAWLVAAGVDPSRLRVTYQPSGDHLGDNGSPDGRRMNRRVEVELYASRPQVALLGAAPAPASVAAGPLQ